jgi:hypothetical protein
MALKITKATEKRLANIAAQLPITTYGVKKHIFKRVNDKQIAKTTIGENLHKVNHKNRLKTVYKDGGVEAVKSYVNDVLELSDSRLNIAVNL